MGRLDHFRNILVLSIATLLGIHLLGVIAPLGAQSRITFNKRQLFLNGCNIAWVNFAADIGPGYTNFGAFGATFDSLHARGGNSMRFWLHTNGATSPQFNASGIVVGPGTNTIADLKAILDSAWQHKVGLMLCLWSFDMLRISFGSGVTDRAMLLLTDTAALSAYVQNALIPMVTALKGHPAILAWEVFNEAEGMSNEYGWDFNYHVPMTNIQRFVNVVAGAIHRTDSTAQVTTGAWAFIALSDVTPAEKMADPAAALQMMSAAERLGLEDAFASRYGARLSAQKILSRFSVTANYNYYRDDRLVTAGGDSRGILDFYTVHYYSWAGTALSPFHHPYGTWALTKPLVVSEFYIDPTFGFQYTELFPNLYSNGYAGAMTWSWYDNLTQRERTKEAMWNLFTLYPDDIDVDPITGKIYMFSALPTLIDSGETSAIAWMTVPGSSVTLDGTPVQRAGTIQVSPPVTTAYRLLAQGSIIDSATMTVEVYQSGKIISFNAAPPAIARGDSCILRWRAANGSRVTLNGVAVNEYDSMFVRPDTTSTYTLIASGVVRDTSARTVSVIPADQVNHALAKNVQVSSSDGNAPTSDPQHIVDGSFSTQWVSASNNAQWILIDLERPYRVRRVSIAWGGNYAKMFRIGISLDNVSWTLMYQNMAGKGGTATIDSLSGVGRYLKIMLDSRASQSSGYAVSEVMAYGLPADVAVDDRTPGDTPTHFILYQNYPNPFNPSTSIRYALPARSRVEIDVYDLLGRRVAQLVNGIEDAGYHTAVWSPDVASGLYFCRMEATSTEHVQHSYGSTRKIIVLK